MEPVHRRAALPAALPPWAQGSGAGLACSVPAGWRADHRHVRGAPGGDSGSHAHPGSPHKVNPESAPRPAVPPRAETWAQRPLQSLEISCTSVHPQSGGERDVAQTQDGMPSSLKRRKFGHVARRGRSPRTSGPRREASRECAAAPVPGGPYRTQIHRRGKRTAGTGPGEGVPTDTGFHCGW